MIADIIRRARLHPDCGIDVELAFDDKQTWLVDHLSVCYACAAREKVHRDLSKKHENDDAWNDGRLVTVRASTAEDLRKAQKGAYQQASRS